MTVPTPAPSNPPPDVRPQDADVRRSGFSFIEVLFAVMILGIGFIMVAAVFPVAISQTASTQEETVAAAAARGAAGAMQNMPYLTAPQVLPETGEVIRLTDDIVTIPGAGPLGAPLNIRPWGLIKGSQILSQDPRFAWVPMLRRLTRDPRAQNPPVVQLIVVPVHVRGRSNFDRVGDLTQIGTNNDAIATLMPLPVRVRLLEGKTDVDTIEFDGVPSQQTRGLPAVVPGAVIVMRRQTEQDVSNRPVAGRVYRLGAPTDRLNGQDPRYELLPGNDMAYQVGLDGVMNTPDDVNESTPNGTWFDAWVVGQAHPAADSGVNGNMAVSVYTTFVNLR